MINAELEQKVHQTALMFKKETDYVEEEASCSKWELISGAYKIIERRKIDRKYSASLYYFSLDAIEVVAGYLIAHGFAVKLLPKASDQYELKVSWEDPVEV
ncbi:hypothetical protein B5G22_00290 [Limosilactobacillus reuteri]|uniref:Uncharacterized protein n=1 Tax=Limosilactobacillus reuteri TaxID=1598 RepID=A0A1Y3UYK5_LIMRT|nr:hypothetical protein [Limosilactobacillus reuteri]OUN50400.1 hypothetical protein B5G22_00290 [Limosilactobacillus reuteri]